MLILLMVVRIVRRGLMHGRVRLRAKAEKRGENKGESVSVELPQLAESVPLPTPLARFGKNVRTASKQTVKKLVMRAPA
jgi:hypothetical protein